MCAGARRAARERLVAQAALVWGQIGDVAEFIESGDVSTTKGQGQAPPITPEVDRYMQAIRKAGRFVMPDEVDKWLAEAGQQDAPPTPQDKAGA